jgi:hypothetical protein
VGAHEAPTTTAQSQEAFAERERIQTRSSATATITSLMDADLFDTGCTCHMGYPPCSFCTGMSEEEADAYCTGGKEALRPFVGRLTDADYELIKLKVMDLFFKI